MGRPLAASLVRAVALNIARSALFDRFVVFIDVHVIFEFKAAASAGSLLLLLLLVSGGLGRLDRLSTEELFDTLHLRSLVGCVPDSFNENAALVGGLPLSLLLLVVHSEEHQFVHICGDRRWVELLQVPVFEEHHFLILLELEVVKMVVVDVKLVAEVRTLALFDLDQTMAAVEGLSSVSVRIVVALVAYGQILGLIDLNAVRVTRMLLGRLVVVLEPFDKMTPEVLVSLHPIAHQGQAEGHLDDPINDGFHPLVVGFIVLNDPTEENLKPLAGSATESG